MEFVVIGGFSLAAHGYVRRTKDLDVVPRPEPANLGRLARALEALEAERLELADFEPEELELQPDASGLALGGNWTLRTRFGRLDVMQHVPGVRDYEQLRARAVETEVPGLDAAPLFAGLDDLSHEARRRPRSGPARNRRARAGARGRHLNAEGRRPAPSL